MSKLKDHKKVKRILKKAWDAQSLRIRDGAVNAVAGMWQCAACGKLVDTPDELQAGHLVHGGNQRSGYGTNKVDFDKRNIWPICVSCNHFSIADAIATLTLKAVAKYGPDIIEELRRIRGTTWKPTIAEAEELLKKQKEDGKK